jgi:hypothetical protein
MTNFTIPADDDKEEAKRSTNDNSALCESLRRRPMATFDIDQQLSEDDDGDDDDNYDDRPLLVLEGSVAKARNQKSPADDRENRIVGVSLLIGTLVALVVLSVASSGSTAQKSGVGRHCLHIDFDGNRRMTYKYSTIASVNTFRNG